MNQVIHTIVEHCDDGESCFFEITHSFTLPNDIDIQTFKARFKELSQSHLSERNSVDEKIKACSRENGMLMKKHINGELSVSEYKTQIEPLTARITELLNQRPKDLTVEAIITEAGGVIYSPEPLFEVDGNFQFLTPDDQES